MVRSRRRRRLSRIRFAITNLPSNRIRRNHKTVVFCTQRYAYRELGSNTTSPIHFQPRKTVNSDNSRSISRRRRLQAGHTQSPLPGNINRSEDMTTQTSTSAAALTLAGTKTPQIKTFFTKAKVRRHSWQRTARSWWTSRQRTAWRRTTSRRRTFWPTRRRRPWQAAPVVEEVEESWGGTHPQNSMATAPDRSPL